MLKITVIILKGFALGISMVLPGISGGTMAFILGIYEKLIGEISKAQTKHLKSLFLCLSFRRKQILQNALFLWNTWDWAFLAPLLFGVVFSGVLFVIFAPPVIDQHPLPFYSVIFGLVVASLFKPFKEMKKTAKSLFLLLLSFAANILLFSFGQNLYLFSGELLPLTFLPVGFLISIALIVPGLSGSYILLILGLYEKTLLAFRQGDLFVIGCFLMGLIIGVFSMAKLIQYLIQNYFNETMAIILGLILGSLYAVYPLPKESWEDILSFDIQKKIFLFYCSISFCIFMSCSFLYEMRSKQIFLKPTK